MKKYLFIFLLLPVFSQAQKVIVPGQGMTSEDRIKGPAGLFSIGTIGGASGNFTGTGPYSTYNTIDLSYGHAIVDDREIFYLMGYTSYLDYFRSDGPDGKAAGLGLGFYTRDADRFVLGGITAEMYANLYLGKDVPAASLITNLGYHLNFYPLLIDLSLGASIFSEKDAIGLHLGTAIRWSNY